MWTFYECWGIKISKEIQNFAFADSSKKYINFSKFFTVIKIYFWLKQTFFKLNCFSTSCVFQFYINFTMDQFYIKLPDGRMMDFPNRLGEVKYDYFEVKGDAVFHGVKIK